MWVCIWMPTPFKENTLRLVGCAIPITQFSIGTNTTWLWISGPTPALNINYDFYVNVMTKCRVFTTPWLISPSIQMNPLSSLQWGMKLLDSWAIKPSIAEFLALGGFASRALFHGAVFLRHISSCQGDVNGSRHAADCPDHLCDVFLLRDSINSRADNGCDGLLCVLINTSGDLLSPPGGLGY